MKARRVTPLTKQDIQRMRELREEGQTLEEIGKTFDVTRSGVSKVLSGHYTHALPRITPAMQAIYDVYVSIPLDKKPAKRDACRRSLWVAFIAMMENRKNE